MSQEETRYYLNGIYLHRQDDEVNEDGIGQMIGVATDGHRLSKLVLGAPHESKGMPGVIIPRKTVIELRKLIEDTTVDILVTVTETKIRFFMDNILLTSKLIMAHSQLIKMLFLLEMRRKLSPRQKIY